MRNPALLPPSECCGSKEVLLLKASGRFYLVIGLMENDTLIVVDPTYGPGARL